MSGRQDLLFALEVDGSGPPGAGTDVAALIGHLSAAEAAGFVLATFDDTPLPVAGGRIEAGVRAAFAARRTSRIGLAPTLHATVTEPFHLATQLASLDHASLGRAGWVVGAANSAAAHATIGGTPLAEPDGLRRELADVIEVARQLWDSWEDDAVIRDVATSRFLDSDRVHHINFTGERFSVVGPLITPRPPQGQVVVLGSDTLGVTENLDIALIAAADLGELADRAHVAHTAGAPLVFAEVEVRPDEGEPSGRLRVTGDDELREVLDRLAGIVDGVRLHPADLATDLPRIAAAVPIRPPSGPTLRAALGLARPANRFAAVAR
ncbi:LLM class flavin-dependent oxidoreductase [Paractinoplanes lichenicola]|uniref:LLM class flavin-dependent oxidoreductase n=1 Tax=Paractinoplanes lichenicola TaxID=2802976 RepID=A0ABS1VDN3_9ACTN|nr:LLM class flavin-dependent oxidoreductase [Actinoplanes lichenicola]MBL7252790.1 LLM class flavin-dependent oxidoreductase [Actinoplanes lichenicola]